MIITYALILFSASFFSGLTVFLSPKAFVKHFAPLLTFSGAYLFSLTLIHIIPELFSQSLDPFKTGIYVLMGFLMQVVLEFFSSGVEHGHMHLHQNETDHKHGLSVFFLLFSLCMHSFLEATIVVQPTTGHSHGNSDVGSILFGIVMHKIPVAFALMSVLIPQVKSKRNAFLALLIFALAPVFGIFIGDFIGTSFDMGGDVMHILFSLVAGNFLHISTTIFFETTPSHSFNFRKIAAIAIGVGSALLVELI